MIVDSKPRFQNIVYKIRWGSEACVSSSVLRDLARTSNVFRINCQRKGIYGLVDGEGHARAYLPMPPCSTWNCVIRNESSSFSTQCPEPRSTSGMCAQTCCPAARLSEPFSNDRSLLAQCDSFLQLWWHDQLQTCLDRSCSWWLGAGEAEEARKRQTEAMRANPTQTSKQSSAKPSRGRSWLILDVECPQTSKFLGVSMLKH